MSNYITPSLKRALRGKTLKPITEDYTMKEVNSMITALLGKPGVSAGKAQRSFDSQIASGNSASSYGSSQMDVQASGMQLGQNAGTVGGSLIGFLRDLVVMAYNRKTDSIAYNRQNDFYNNHLSMPAKVQEYEDAGLNPMGLAGAGAGATSAPSVQGTGAPELDGLTSMLGGLLSYKAQMARVEVDRERVQAQKEDIASRIEYRAEQKYYQQKLNEWFDTNQIVSLDKMKAETALAYEKINTEATQQKLNEAGVSAAEARALLDFQSALQKEFENSPAYRRAELGLMNAHQNLYNADAAESWQNVENLKSVRDNVIQDTALKLAQTEQGKQMLVNLGLTAEQIKFAVDHQKGDLIFNRINQVTSSLKDVGVAVGGISSAITGISSLSYGTTIPFGTF